MQGQAKEDLKIVRDVPEGELEDRQLFEAGDEVCVFEED
jgi:hypothetical protein